MTADPSSRSEGDECEARYLMEVIVYVGAVQADTLQTGLMDALRTMWEAQRVDGWIEGVTLVAPP